MCRRRLGNGALGTWAWGVEWSGVARIEACPKHPSHQDAASPSSSSASSSLATTSMACSWHKVVMPQLFDCLCSLAVGPQGGGCLYRSPLAHCSPSHHAGTAAFKPVVSGFKSFFNFVLLKNSRMILEQTNIQLGKRALSCSNRVVSYQLWAYSEITSSPLFVPSTVARCISQLNVPRVSHTLSGVVCTWLIGRHSQTVLFSFSIWRSSTSFRSLSCLFFFISVYLFPSFLILNLACLMARAEARCLRKFFRPSLLA